MRDSVWCLRDLKEAIVVLAAYLVEHLPGNYTVHFKIFNNYKLQVRKVFSSEMYLTDSRFCQATGLLRRLSRS